MSWFSKIIPSKVLTEKKKGIPEGLWSKCPDCGSFLFNAELLRNLKVCPKCDYHFGLSARTRLSQFLDNEGCLEIGADIKPVDRLKFRDTKKYKDRLSQAQKITGEQDALVVMRGSVKQVPVVVCAFEFGFIGGSMGAVVGERFVQAVNVCLKDRLPLVCFSASGGARMQEGLISLMQMGKTSAALAHLAEARLPFISVMVNPCSGGVSASLAMLGDINIAEPKAFIGFAGPKVIQQTVGETLPEGFQRSEFLLEKGAIDMIVDRRNLRDRISELLSKLLYYPTAVNQ